eukprot:m.33975 g.33975  ORF g.33975 m.33975 type:complete len:320 (-) comp9706_c0_seq2:1247-2206(-)
MEEDAATKSPPDEAASCLREDTELQQYLGVLCEEVDGYDSFASTPVVAALQAHVIDDIPAISPMRKIAPGSKEAPAPLASAQVARGPLHAIDNLYARCSAQTQKKSQHQQGMSSFHVQDSAAVQPCLRKHRPIPVPLEVCLPPESALAQLESVVDLDVSQLIAPERENAFLSHAVRHSEPSYIRMAVHQGSRRPRCGQFQEPPASETSSPVAPGQQTQERKKTQRCKATSQKRAAAAKSSRTVQKRRERRLRNKRQTEMVRRGVQKEWLCTLKRVLHLDDSTSVTDTYITAVQTIEELQDKLEGDVEGGCIAEDSIVTN